MKKQQVDHVLRAAGRITGQKRFIIIGSQALHGRHPDPVLMPLTPGPCFYLSRTGEMPGSTRTTRAGLVSADGRTAARSELTEPLTSSDTWAPAPIRVRYNVPSQTPQHAINVMPTSSVPGRILAKKFRKLRRGGYVILAPFYLERKGGMSESSTVRRRSRIRASLAGRSILAASLLTRS